MTDPVTSIIDIVTGLTWMDRNLGAAASTPYINGSFDNDQWVKTTGLFYQWGRKDAFPGSNGTDNNQTYYTPVDPGGTTANFPGSSYTELPDMVQNPLNFANNITSYYGSVNQGLNNDSWGGESGQKTVYDPCPPGWRVPPISIAGDNSWGSSGDWDTWTYYGLVFNGVNGMAGLSHFYPLAGRRLSTTGVVSRASTIGYYWSASQEASSTPRSSNLLINSSGVYPASQDQRVCGFSVRCVVE